MAVCEYCGKEMRDKVGCLDGMTVEYPGGKILDAIKASDDCGDCGCPAGTYHHPGCDMESCPKCGGQLISCGCLADGDDFDS